MDPRIDGRIDTCGSTPCMLATPMRKEVITDATCSSVWVSRTPSHVSQTVRDGTTPYKCDIDVSSPWANSPVLIEGISMSPASGHSGSL